SASGASGKLETLVDPRCDDGRGVRRLAVRQLLGGDRNVAKLLFRFACRIASAFGGESRYRERLPGHDHLWPDGAPGAVSRDAGRLSTGPGIHVALAEPAPARLTAGRARLAPRRARDDVMATYTIRNGGKPARASAYGCVWPHSARGDVDW